MLTAAEKKNLKNLLAMAEDPNNPYFAQQAVRFEEELRQQELASK